jgi:hypothetical protein
MAAGRPSPLRGRQLEACVICERPSSRHVHPPAPWRPKYEPDANLRPAGVPVCWSHAPVSPCAQLGREHLPLGDRADGRVTCWRCNQDLGPEAAWLPYDCPRCKRRQIVPRDAAAPSCCDVRSWLGLWAHQLPLGPSPATTGLDLVPPRGAIIGAEKDGTR